jgi:hypothetical protein
VGRSIHLGLVEGAVGGDGDAQSAGGEGVDEGSVGGCQRWALDEEEQRKERMDVMGLMVNDKEGRGEEHEDDEDTNEQNANGKTKKPT